MCRRHSFILILILVSLFVFAGGAALAQEQAPDYLKYQEPQPTSVSLLSTISYVMSLLIVFGAVIGLAFFTSRYMGKKMNGFTTLSGGKILSSLSLGPNRFIYVIEITGKCFILGVTEQCINLLYEITDPVEIEKLRKKEIIDTSKNQFEVLFQKQIHALQGMSEKFPGVFGSVDKKRQDDEGEKR